MLEQILSHIRNWFEVGIYSDVYTIRGGTMELPFLQAGQYFRIDGSVFNDGLHQYPAYDLADETFDGTVRALAIPQAVIALSEEVKAWSDKYGEAATSPYLSETFGGYSYSKGSATGQNQAASTWQSAFAARLNPWRKI